MMDPTHKVVLQQLSSLLSLMAPAERRFDLNDYRPAGGLTSQSYIGATAEAFFIDLTKV
jgi:hypothetical protein